ncbi:hypothetical protein GCM10027295_37190 [Pseudaeromonas pectinilytica]
MARCKKTSNGEIHHHQVIVIYVKRLYQTQRPIINHIKKQRKTIVSKCVGIISITSKRFYLPPIFNNGEVKCEIMNPYL